jgi:hypothetical protein
MLSKTATVVIPPAYTASRYVRKAAAVKNSEPVKKVTASGVAGDRAECERTSARPI